jgi:hypothetical protein
MPYDYFTRALKWKAELEDEKTRRINEKTGNKNKPHNPRKFKPGIRKLGRTV